MVRECKTTKYRLYLDEAGAEFFAQKIATGGKFEEGGLAFDPLDDPEEALALAADVRPGRRRGRRRGGLRARRGGAAGRRPRPLPVDVLDEATTPSAVASRGRRRPQDPAGVEDAGVVD